MAGAIRKCRVCGKEYEACRSVMNVDGIFRWKEVACSPDCGSIYLAKILESRKQKDMPVVAEDANIEEVIVSKAISVVEPDAEEDVHYSKPRRKKSQKSN